MSGNRLPGTLALSFQEVLTAGARLHWKRQDPRDTTVFRQHCRQAIDSGAQDARDAGYSPQDIRSAIYAVAVYLDEVVLQTADARFAAWIGQPLESEIFGTRNGNEQFYEQLRQVLGRPDQHDSADLAEIYLLCLLLGFVGMYGPATGARRDLLRRAADKLRAVRGPLAELSPAWRIPSSPRPPAAPSAARIPLSPPTPATAAIDAAARQADSRLAIMGAGGSLASMPAMLVLGEPGSVKTSTILHSGVTKDLIAGDIVPGGNVPPTALANFWFLRPALVVEAGGAMLADRAAWCRLLEHLRPERSAPRVALVCADSERFTRANASEMASRGAHYLRAHLEEYAQAVGARIPVYVVFTRMDRVMGFNEFTRKLTLDESGRTLGATLAEFTAPGDTAAALATRLKQAYVGIYRSLTLARSELMARDFDFPRLDALYEFPREFHKLKPLVVQYLSELCPPGPVSGSFLRGFYFSGARAIVMEEDGPSQRAAADEGLHATRMFGAGGVAIPKPVTAVPARRKVPQWLFLSHLFHHVVMADYLANR